MASTERTKTRFESFMQGFAAAVQLSQRAVKNGSFIESVCLSASVIDAQLRIGLILEHQLKTKSDCILDELLCQADAKNIITERNIYKQALEKNIISQNVYQELNDLYNKRNKIVHQYIISDITTETVLNIAAKYSDMVHIVKESVRRLEDEQLRLGVGMTKAGDVVPKSIRGEAKEIINNLADKKHDNSNLVKNLRSNSGPSGLRGDQRKPSA